MLKAAVVKSRAVKDGVFRAAITEQDVSIVRFGAIETGEPCCQQFASDGRCASPIGIC